MHSVVFKSKKHGDTKDTEFHEESSLCYSPAGAGQVMFSVFLW